MMTLDFGAIMVDFKFTSYEPTFDSEFTVDA